MIKKFIIRSLMRLQRWSRKKNFRRALELAQREAEQTGKTQLIVFIEGEYRVYEKQYLKRLRKEQGRFRGMSNEDIENMADLKIYKHVRPKRKEAC